ncbi:dihydrofolate reductase family protein [Georgenia sp. AZ-5]|uniref:dihydrofolate reductase family protein n=1 Tax=Georgenia sp. AZ-5 TaxID=3367526 RepID=UPI003754EBEC
MIVQELTTADGFVAGTDGGLDFFGAVTDYDEVDRDNVAQLAGVDTIALGAATYAMFSGYWPTAAAEAEVMAEMVNTTPKVVYSSTLTEAPWGGYPPARVVRGSATEHVADARRQDGGDIVVWGSISLARSLFAADLVDELQLRVIPVVIGAGRSLLSAEAGRRDLTLLEAKAYASGIVALRYDARRR